MSLAIFDLDNTLLSDDSDFLWGQFLVDQRIVDKNQYLENSWFYSDSHNDLPLLELVDNPVAVDPDEKLRAYAEQKDWSIISLRG